ncbi:MAG: hypothetical protein ACJ74Q_06265 [Pyrinomonadaceae bacterium]
MAAILDRFNAAHAKKHSSDADRVGLYAASSAYRSSAFIRELARECGRSPQSVKTLSGRLRELRERHQRDTHQAKTTRDNLKVRREELELLAAEHASFLEAAGPFEQPANVVEAQRMLDATHFLLDRLELAEAEVADADSGINLDAFLAGAERWRDRLLVERETIRAKAESLVIPPDADVARHAGSRGLFERFRVVEDALSDALECVNFLKREQKPYFAGTSPSPAARTSYRGGVTRPNWRGSGG